MKRKRTSPTTPTSGEITQKSSPTVGQLRTEWVSFASNPFSWSPGYEPKGKECDPLGHPTIFEYSSKTHQLVLQAKWLRKMLKLSLPELSSTLGYSPSKVLAFERGYDTNGKALPQHKWKRYMWALMGLYRMRMDDQKALWEDAQGDARVQARQPAPGDRQAGKKGRQGHRPKAGDRHRVE